MYEKEKMLTFTSVKLGKNKKGDHRLQLYLDAKTAADLAETSINCATKNPKGIQLDLHFGDRQSKQGNTFTSAYMFIREKKEQQTNAYRSNSPQTTNVDELQSKINNLKGGQNYDNRY